ncbi:sensor histidine kinase [Lichenifustis flavocetrariae]|uniref:histidine kinase n=1 Tax=Lichenifustis flavocetrariae TaxID=2949735 RepID=A0AA41YYH5_9HYPH|nr:HAMP domain-containing sensor histidine kinase [Lichenifustis flavocetrariae]MCW6509630.1 HAMP domain-containing histidine kinase [Lichenifustis flavocetrariae]
MNLDAQRRLKLSEATILDERQASELREQFIAVLGHDLCNPLASVDAGTRALGRIVKDDKAATIVTLIQGSVRRMAGLIDNVLDFARGRLGGGLSLSRERCDLEPILRQVVDELRSSQPDRTIETHFRGIEAVDCDGRRVGQLVSNLLANALTHGADDRPVRIEAIVDRAAFELSVANEGKPIPVEVLERIFQPFERGAVRPGQQGLGLGLYIASEIAQSHGGTLEALSSSDGTRFTFRIPAAIRPG